MHNGVMTTMIMMTEVIVMIVILIRFNRMIFVIKVVILVIMLMIAIPITSMTRKVFTINSCNISKKKAPSK